jgi:transcriptional regulator with XRE-family HTH domain
MNDSKLREVRIKKGIGQIELAEKVGLTQGMISQIETKSRRARPQIMEEIARVLDCSVEEISETNEPSLVVQFIRNCKKLSYEQLNAVNELIKLLGASNETTKN